MANREAELLRNSPARRCRPEVARASTASQHATSPIHPAVVNTLGYLSPAQCEKILREGEALLASGI